MVIETLVIGLVVAAIYVEVTDISPGGIIVPGYMALYLDQPLRILMTLVVAAISVLSFRFLSRFLILYGRRRFVMMILLGGVWAEVWLLLLPHLFAASFELRVIGWVIPGVLGNNLLRQKPMPVLASLATVAVITYFLVRLI